MDRWISQLQIDLFIYSSFCQKFTLAHYALMSFLATVAFFKMCRCPVNFKCNTFSPKKSGHYYYFFIELVSFPLLPHFSPENKLHCFLYEAQLQRLTLPSRHLPPFAPLFCSPLSLFCLDGFLALIHYLTISSLFQWSINRRQDPRAKQRVHQFPFVGGISI